MKTRMTDVRIAALSSIAFCFVLTIVAFFTPNWLASEKRIYGADFVKLGLWETCFRSLRGPEDLDHRKYYAGCRWIFADEYQYIRGYLMPGLFCFDRWILMTSTLFLKNRINCIHSFILGFFVATQVLYTIGFVFLLLAVIGVLAIQLCFVVDKEMNAMKALSITMLLSSKHFQISWLLWLMNPHLYWRCILHNRGHYLWN